MATTEATSQLTIRTSDEGWVAALAQAYEQRRAVTLIDDARVGVDPAEQALLHMGREEGLSAREWAGVLAALGLSGVGVALIMAAILSPEPTSSLAALLAGGVAFIGGGGMSAVSILRGTRPPTVRLDGQGFQITWEDDSE